MRIMRKLCKKHKLSCAYFFVFFLREKYKNLRIKKNSKKICAFRKTHKILRVMRIMRILMRIFFCVFF